MTIGRNLAILVLSLLTGFVLAQVLATPLAFNRSTPRLERSSNAAAAAFYAAVNGYLEDGEPATLEAVLADDFIDHSAIGENQDSADLVRYLSALRTIYPDLRLDVSSMTPRNDMVAVAVGTTGGTSAARSPFVPDHLPSEPGFEHLRIVDDKVAERWPRATLAPQIEKLSEIQVATRSGWFIDCALQHVSLEPDSAATFREESHSLLIATSGIVALEVSPRDEPAPLLVMSGGVTGEIPIRRGQLIELHGESVVQFAPGESYRIWNGGRVGADAIVIELSYQTPILIFSDGHSELVDIPVDESRDLPSGLLPLGTGPDRSFALSLLRVAAAPGEAFGVHTVDGLEQAIVASGTIEVDPYEGFISIFGGEYVETAMPGVPVTLLPGDGINANDESRLSYRVGGDAPAEFWVVTLVPVIQPDQ